MVAREEKSSAHLFLLLIFRQTEIDNRKPENNQKATLRRHSAGKHEFRITKTVFQRSFVI